MPKHLHSPIALFPLRSGPGWSAPEHPRVGRARPRDDKDLTALSLAATPSAPAPRRYRRAISARANLRAALPATAGRGRNRTAPAEPRAKDGALALCARVVPRSPLPSRSAHAAAPRRALPRRGGAGAFAGTPAGTSVRRRRRRRVGVGICRQKPGFSRSRRGRTWLAAKLIEVPRRQLEEKIGAARWDCAPRARPSPAALIRADAPVASQDFPLPLAASCPRATRPPRR